MIKKFKYTGFRFLTALLVLAVFSINITALIHCSNLASEEDCCHIQNTVKPCCVKNLKISLYERITGNCGCSMKESQKAPDLFTDMLSGSNSKIQKNTFHSSLNSMFVTESEHSLNNEYSPTIPVSNCIYLSNLNLRI